MARFFLLILRGPSDRRIQFFKPGLFLKKSLFNHLAPIASIVSGHKICTSHVLSAFAGPIRRGKDSSGSPVETVLPVRQ
jgi:hypothetical protein